MRVYGVKIPTVHKLKYGSSMPCFAGCAVVVCLLLSASKEKRALFQLLPSSIKILRQLLVHKLPLKPVKQAKNMP